MAIMPGQDRPSVMSLKPLVWLYAFVFAYAAACYFLRETLALLTIMIGFGAPILLYLALEYGAPPLIACIAGYYSRRSVLVSVLLGYPLVVTAALIFPVGTARNVLGVPVPWLAAYKESSATVIPEIEARLPWYTLAFVAFVLIGVAHRRYLSRKHRS